MEKLIENIKKNKDLRTSLIELKSKTKELSDKELYISLVKYLNNEDPKVRKNSALLLGMYEDKDVVQVLLKCYLKEQTEYVKEAYLKGCLNHDCFDYLELLENIQKQLLSNQEEENKKHVQAQLKIINQLISNNKKIRKRINQQHNYVDVVLTTLPYYQYTLMNELKGYMYKAVGQGVLVRTSAILDLLYIRYYDELLIPLSGCSSLDINEHIADKIINSSLKQILFHLFNENLFYFKIVDGLKTKNSSLTKQIADRLSQKCSDYLLNSPHNYEIEIVLKELKKDKVNVYLKIMALDRRRFQYRKEATSFSMKPYIAATLTALAKPYLMNYARVLDPFCGSGTLLIERNVAKHAHFMMGLDIYGKGLDIAKMNSQRAKMNIHYVNRDVLTFTNEEEFDEIFTDMPTLEQVNDNEKLIDLYDKFFNKIRKLVKSGGYAFIYTSELSLVRKNLRLNQRTLELIEHYEILRGRKTYHFFILKVK